MAAGDPSRAPYLWVVTVVQTDHEGIGGPDFDDPSEERDKIPEPSLIHAELRYQAFATDLDYMWRWEIRCDGEFVQEGCSLSKRAAKEAVAHVIAFFRTQDASRGSPDDKTDEIRELLKGIGTPRSENPAD